MMSLVAVIRIHLRMASVTNKSVFSIITTDNTGSGWYMSQAQV